MGRKFPSDRRETRRAKRSDLQRARNEVRQTIGHDECVCGHLKDEHTDSGSMCHICVDCRGYRLWLGGGD